MTRVSLFVLMSSLVPAVAGAQMPVPPAPPAPPAAPAPPPAPPAPPAPHVMVPPAFDSYYLVDQDAVRQAAEAARAAVRVDADAVREAARQASEQMRQAQQMQTFRMDEMRYAFDMQDGFSVAARAGNASLDGNYSRGLSLLQSHQYDQAIVSFDRVIVGKAKNADGAYYYKAWAQSKLGKSEDAVATLSELRKTYPSSRYLNDAKALEADVKKLGPGQVDDDDIKLLAIQGIQNAEPTRAIPLLESVLNSTNSLAVKRRALYVIALLDRPEAHQLLLSYAKGKGNPDLQREAIQYLGARGRQQTSSAELIDIYNSNPDVDVRLSVINAFRSAGDKTSLMRLASGDGWGGPKTVVASGGGLGSGSVNLVTAGGVSTAERGRAINNLSDLASPQELWPLYQKEENKDLRSEWVGAFASMGATDQLMQVVKTEREPAVRQRAIRALGSVKGDKTGATLVELYNGESDKDTRKAVISALGSQGNAESLIAIARKEQDRDLKMAIVQRLVEMSSHNKAAADYLMEIVK